MNFLHTEGTRIVDEDGNEVLLTGYAFGNWMVQEAFLFGTGSFHADFKPFMRAEGLDRGRAIDRAIRELCGEAYARDFWQRFWRAYIAEDDIAYLAAQGMNSVRLPLNARALLREEPGYVWDEGTFEHLSQVLDWCERHGVYAVLDLHAAVAGQSAIGCDDGVDNQPHLFTDEDGWERTICLWEELARRFGDRACVAGYELLNEPLALPVWDGLWGELVRFYDECIARIRAIDERHMFFLQGARFASRSDMLRPDMDPAGNWVCAYHVYETLPDLGLMGPILAERERLGVPIWVGETGGTAAWMTTTYEMLRSFHIGVNVWVAKAVWRPNAATLLTYEVPEGFAEMCDYILKGTAKPSYEHAQAIWDAYLERVRFAACDQHPEQARAILRGAGAEVPAVGYDVLPGAGASFAGRYSWCTYCGYRREDPMEMVLADDKPPYDWGNFKGMARVPKYGDFTRLALRLNEGDFACYTFHFAQSAVVRLTARSAEGATARIEAAGKKTSCAVSGGQWSDTAVLALPAGDVTVKVSCARGVLDVLTVHSVEA